MISCFVIFEVVFRGLDWCYFGLIAQEQLLLAPLLLSQVQKHKPHLIDGLITLN